MTAQADRIATRIVSLLERQIGVLRESVAEFDEFLDQPAQEADATFAVQEQQRAQHIAQMDEELRILRKEWDAAQDVDEDERRQVRTLARETRELVEQLQSRIERTGDALGDEMSTLKSSMQELNRGKQMIRGYTVGDGSQATGLDRQA